MIVLAERLVLNPYIRKLKPWMTFENDYGEHDGFRRVCYLMQKSGESGRFNTTSLIGGQLAFGLHSEWFAEALKGVPTTVQTRAQVVVHLEADQVDYFKRMRMQV